MYNKQLIPEDQQPETSATQPNNPPYPQQPYGGYPQMYPIYKAPRKPVPVLQLLQIIFSALGIAAGILCIILGFNKIYYLYDFRWYIVYESYGVDAYTGIQNAIANVNHNIADLGDFIECIGQYFFFMLGIILIIAFTKRLFTDIDNFKKAKKELEIEGKYDKL